MVEEGREIRGNVAASPIVPIVTIVTTKMKNKIKKNLTATSWTEFETLHGDYIKASSAYEHLFLTEVIFKIPELHPEDLVGQYKFEDDNGKTRLIDFAILIGGMPSIAIEVDGYDKTGSGSGMSKDEWGDFTYRQNQITMREMTLLRFSNREISRNPHSAISLIQKAIQQQKNKLHNSTLPRSIGGLAATLTSFASGFFKAASISYEANRRMSKERNDAAIEELRKKYGLDKNKKR